MTNEMISESEDARSMRESIEEMEREVAQMDNDIAEAKRLPDAEMREVALRNFEQMRKSTCEMIASFKETYRLMLNSEVHLANLSKEG